MNIRIGLDFDNTIVNYDEVFKEIAIKLKIIPKNWKGSKAELRSYLLKKNYENLWKKLQGLVYGKYMSKAKVNPGFKNFLLKAKILKAKVYIVSHKSIYGHYDKEKHLLRSAALKWIKKNKITLVEKIYFESTILEKVKKIEELKLDFFVDDLSLILEHKFFPKKTKKILYNKSLPKIKNKKIILTNTWSRVKSVIFGHDNVDHLKKYCEYIYKKKIIYLNKIKGQKNSELYKVKFNDNRYGAIKKYPNLDDDGRQRLQREILAIKVMQKNNFKNITKLISYNVDLNIALFKWIDGKKIKTIKNSELSNAVNFIKKLKKISHSQVKKYFYNAVEPCFTLKDIKNQITQKKNNLVKNNYSKKIKIFIKFFFNPSFEKTINNTIAKKTFSIKVNNRSIILSPSDFGFHNCLKTDKKDFVFLDFEYFGRDDAIKLVTDFLLHPGMLLANSQKKTWIRKMLIIFKNDTSFQHRLRTFIPYYALRWALIVLNDFRIQNVNKYCKDNRINKFNFLKKRDNQIKKAIFFCNIAKKETYKKWLII